MSKISDTLSVLDFSKKSLKAWLQHFQELFDRKFVMNRVAKLAVIYNSCSPSLKYRCLTMDVGSIKQKMMITRFKICSAPLQFYHAEAVLQSLYAGVGQNSSDSVSVHLEKMRELGEDAYGPSNRWMMNQASLLITKIVAGLRDRNLSMLTSSYVVRIPFDFPGFRETVIQYEQRIPRATPMVHALTNLRCFWCDGEHHLKDCSLKKCL